MAEPIELEVVDFEGTELIKLEKVNPVTLFTENGLDPILKEIERQVSGKEIDLSTDKGRKEIASNAHKVSRSKVLLDGLGKDLVAGWKTKAKKVDAARKQAREFLDNLRDTVRQPLTEYEEAVKAEEAEKRRIVEFNIDHEDALALNELFDLKREKEEREAAEAKKKAEEEAAAEAARIEKERLEREERLKKEAAERAKREAEEKAEAEKQAILKREADAKAAKEKAEREAKEAAERAERDRVAAEERAKAAAAKAEQDKKNAVAKAEREKQEAILAEQLRIAEESERKEKDRIAREKAAKDEADRKARNMNHQRKVNREAADDFVKILGVQEIVGKAIVEAIAKNQVRNCTINYY